MFDPGDIPKNLLVPVNQVVDRIQEVAPELETPRVMLVGAFCRDLIHAALGDATPTRRTHDLDLALGIGTWSVYDAITQRFPQVSDSGICFRIAEIDVDVLPFGPVEEPPGIVEPPTRGEPFSVWGFEEIHSAALPLSLPGGQVITLPTVPGYAAAKLAAWLDRSVHGEYKDATDLAVVVHWYLESPVVQARLYEGDGTGGFQAEGFDLSLAAARQLGADISATIGQPRISELLARWPGNLELLVRELQSPGLGPWPARERRRELIDALTRGLNEA